MKPIVDLRLAGEFVAIGKHLEDCADLANSAIEWARLTKDEDLLERAAHLKERVDGSDA